MMMGTADGLGILIPMLSNQATAIPVEGAAGGGSPLARVLQWSEKETRDFIAIRRELERDFTVSKRNKALWEKVAARMKDRGYRRGPEQCKCKWKNLVNRYKGKETSDPENGKQCPFFDELHAIFVERAVNMQQLLLESKTGSPNPFTKKLKRSNKDKLSYESSDSNEDDEEGSGSKVHEQKKSKLANRSIQELLREFFQEQQRNEAQWRDLIERRAEERWIYQNEWRKSMDKLERERLMLEQSWQEREEQRRLREESRAVKRDALLTAILTKLMHEDL